MSMTTPAAPSLVYDVEPLNERVKAHIVRPAQRPSDHRLPELWTYVGEHPQVPKIAQVRGRTLVCLIDTTPEGKKKWRAIAQSLSIPHGHLADVMKSQPCNSLMCHYRQRITDIRHVAWTKLDVGDHVFVRDCRGNGNPMQDVLMMWVGNPYVQTHAVGPDRYSHFVLQRPLA